MVKDLINAGELPKDKIYLACDAKKVFRHKEKAMKKAESSTMIRLEEDRVKGIFFDGEKDKSTKILTFNEDSKHYHSGTVEEEHYTVPWEPSGKYLFHYTPEAADAEEKAAKKIADPIYEWLLVRDLAGDLVMIRGDFTSTIKGSAGGVM